MVIGHRLAIRLNEIGFHVYAGCLDPQGSGAEDLRTKCKHESAMCVLELDVTRDDHIDRCFHIIESDLQTRDYKLWSVLYGLPENSYHFLDYHVVSRIIITASLGGRVAADMLGAYCMTKAAIISFSDSLRREMSKFNISVTTIEPGVFKTSMVNNACPLLQSSWSCTDPDIQQIYGQTYIDEVLRIVAGGGGLAADAGDDIDIVVNDMMAAVVRRRPARYYRPVKGLMPSLAARFVAITPQWMIDSYFCSINPLVPVAMTETNGSDPLDTAIGCDSGFGNALALRLNSMGFRVYACVLDTNSTGAQDLSNKCQFKDEICIVRMDVTIDEDIDW
ncbi:unnamed protein product, partial [Medioppia subpectinata]